MAEKHTAEMRKNHRARVRKRILEQGASSLELYKLLEAFLYSVRPRVDTYPIAHELLAKFKTVDGVFSAPLDELMKVDGVGKVTAEHIMLTGELINRAVISDLTSAPLDADARVIPLLVWMMRNSKTDTVALIGLDSKMNYLDFKILDAEIASEEIKNSILRFAKSGAEKIIFAHRHPGRIGVPTAADIESTKVLVKMCSGAGVTAVEHYVVTKSGAFGIMKDRKAAFGGEV
ncbi:MAG: hypothetical protein IJS45_07925 [Clostridia bacterium]|nr:hypothetical protein [Clostridia bacterium]